MACGQSLVEGEVWTRRRQQTWPGTGAQQLFLTTRLREDKLAIY
jgi:hypothetical protein